MIFKGVNFGRFKGNPDLINATFVGERYIRYGIIQNNKIEWLSEEMFASSAVNLSYEEWINERREEIQAEIDFCDDEVKKQELIDILESENFGEYENDNDTYLIGDWKKNEEGKYEVDREGEEGYSALVGEIYTSVLWSKWIAKCALCSPCFPNAGDLQTEGENETFAIPPEIVGTGEQVACETH